MCVCVCVCWVNNRIQVRVCVCGFIMEKGRKKCVGVCRCPVCELGHRASLHVHHTENKKAYCIAGWRFLKIFGCLLNVCSSSFEISEEISSEI